MLHAMVCVAISTMLRLKADSTSGATMREKKTKLKKKALLGKCEGIGEYWIRPFACFLFSCGSKKFIRASTLWAKNRCKLQCFRLAVQKLRKKSFSLFLWYRLCHQTAATFYRLFMTQKKLSVGSMTQLITSPPPNPRVGWEEENVERLDNERLWCENVGWFRFIYEAINLFISVRNRNEWESGGKTNFHGWKKENMGFMGNVSNIDLPRSERMRRVVAERIQLKIHFCSV